MEFFTQPCPAVLAPLQAYAEILAAKTGLKSLPLHVHQVLGALVAYQAIFVVISPALSRLLVPGFYNKLPRRTQVNWDVHVVSFVQSTFICLLALWGVVNDQQRSAATAVGAAVSADEAMVYKVFGYTVIGGAIQGYACGYFLWDLLISVYHIEITGLGFVAHAVSALVVFSLGFRPFVNYYGPIFILFELSSPFLNIHWFCDKLDLTGSIYQLINGFLLVGTFFCCRLLWGTYNSIMVFLDVFTVYAKPSTKVGGPFQDRELPLWLVVVYLGSNIVLNGLNYYWFSRMIKTIAARFTKKEKVKAGADTVWVEGTDIDIATSAEIVGNQAREIRRRHSASRH